MKFIEDTTLVSDSLRITAGNKFLVGRARCARTGVQYYHGAEVGAPDKDIVAVYRPPDEVLKETSIASFAHKPVTNDHPAEPVTAANWRQVAVGQLGGELSHDGKWIYVPLVLMDQAAINDVQQANKREVSLGYEMDLVWEAGVTPDGVQYDAQQRNIMVNHLALVDRARAGKECRIIDWGACSINVADTTHTPTTKMSEKLQTVDVDGISIETTDQGAQALVKLQRAADGLHEQLKGKDGELAAKDALLAARDAEIERLKGQIPGPEALNAMVRERATLVASLKSIGVDDIDGKSNLECKRAALDKLRGAGFSKDKSDAYIEPAFDLVMADHLAKSPANDPVRNFMTSTDHHKAAAVDEADSDYDKWLHDSWQ
jgi:hypothetical protein